MDKSPDAFRTISEVADWLGTPTHVLRFWESRFTQVKPVKRAGGRRYYRPKDMELLGGIKKLLHGDGMTIRGVQKLLRKEGVRYVAALSPPIDGSKIIAATEDHAAIELNAVPEPIENVVDLPSKKEPEPTPEPKIKTSDAPTETVSEPDAKIAQPATPIQLDVPEDPDDNDTSIDEGGIDITKVAAALRMASGIDVDNPPSPNALTDIYDRLITLRKTMDRAENTDQAD